MSQQQFLDAMELAGVSFFEFDIKTRQYTFNDPFYAFLGTTAEEEGGYSMSFDDFTARFVHPEMWSLLRHRIDHPAGPGEEQPPSCELTTIGKDGSLRKVSARIKAVKDAFGNVIRIKGIIQYLAEEKAEESLREKEEHFRSYIEHSSDLLLVVDSNGTVVYAGPSIQSLLGYKPGEIEGTEGYWLIHPEDRKMVMHTAEATYSHPGNSSPPVEIRYHHKNETWRCFEVIGTVFTYLQGEHYLVINGRDITERKMTDKALRESEARFRLLAENSNDLIWYWELPSKKIIYVSPSVQHFLGYTVDEIMLQNKISIMDVFAPASRAKAAEILMVLATEISEGKHPENYRSEIEYLHKDGSIICAEANVRVVYDQDGSLFGFQGISRDITDRKRAEEALEKRTDELLRSNAELEQFAYIASHDLQEPLRMITSYTELLKKRYSSGFDDDANEFMTFIVDGASRMKQLINDLLAYSRVGTKRKPPEPTDSQTILDKVLLNLGIAMKESSATVTSDFLPVIMADPVQLVQLFQNLVGNAIKFHGEKPPRIHVSAKQQNNEWVFSIHDDGIGIDSQHFDRIFMIFQRLHTRQEYSGTGIGLAVCKKIVENMGGRIWVESEPGKGTTFFFAVPQRIL